MRRSEIKKSSVRCQMPVGKIFGSLDLENFGFNNKDFKM